MSFLEEVKSLFGSVEDAWVVDLKRLQEYEGVERLDELINFLILVRQGKCPDYEAVAKTAELDSLGDGDYYRFKPKDVPFFNSADKGLNTNYLPIYISELTGLVDKDSCVCAFSMIQLSYVAHSGHVLRWEEEKAIKLSNLIVMLTFYLEDFDKPEYPLPEFDSTFFKKISKIGWEDKRAKQLEHDIYYGCFADANYLTGVPAIFGRTFGHADLYFMACNAIRNGRDSVNCDDVVAGYFIIFKILLTDIRTYVWKYYDSDNDPKITHWWDKLI